MNIMDDKVRQWRRDERVHAIAVAFVRGAILGTLIAAGYIAACVIGGAA